MESLCKTRSRIHVTQETLPGTVCLRLWPFENICRVKSGDYGQKGEEKELTATKKGTWEISVKTKLQNSDDRT